MNFSFNHKKIQNWWLCLFGLLPRDFLLQCIFFPRREATTRNRFSSAEINVRLLSLWWLWRVSLADATTTASWCPYYATTSRKLSPLRNPHHLLSEAENGETAYVSVSTYKKVKKISTHLWFSTTCHSVETIVKNVSFYHLSDRIDFKRSQVISFTWKWDLFNGIGTLWLTVFQHSLTKFFRLDEQWMNRLTRLCAAFQTLDEESLINTMSENVLKLSWTSTTTVEDQVSDHHDAVSMTNTTRVKKTLKQQRNSKNLFCSDSYHSPERRWRVMQ